MSRRLLHADRSTCPIAHALDVVGDRWSLLIIRDIAFRGLHEFAEFRAGREGIASNILTDRLNRLVGYGILGVQRHPESKRRKRYFLTERGIGLIPILVDLTSWSVTSLPTGSEFHLDVGAMSERDVRDFIDDKVADARAWYRAHVADPG